MPSGGSVTRAAPLGWVFRIRTTPTRNRLALHPTLDDIIRATGPARNEFIVTREKTEEELAEREAELRREASLDPAVGTTQPPNDGT